MIKYCGTFCIWIPGYCNFYVLIVLLRGKCNICCIIIGIHFTSQELGSLRYTDRLVPIIHLFFYFILLCSLFVMFQMFVYYFRAHSQFLIYFSYCSSFISCACCKPYDVQKLY